MASEHQAVEIAQLTTSGRKDPNQAATRLALFDQDGNPVDIPALTAALEDVRTAQADLESRVRTLEDA